MSVAGLVDRYARAIALAIALLAGAGIVAGNNLPSSIYPRLEFPRVVIIGHSGTLPARAMMMSVTRPLEQAVMEVPGIRRVRSTTFRGATEISAQFEPSSNMVVALQQVQGKIDDARTTLPEGTDLIVERLTPAAFPMYILNLTGPLSSAELYDYAFYVMRPRLARVPGAGQVAVSASDTREIEVVTDPARLLAAGLTVHDVAEKLKAANGLAPVGRYSTGGVQQLVLASGLWSSIEQIPETPIAVRPEGVLRVRDVGQVFPGAPDRTGLITGNGKDAASISVSQQVGANILDIETSVQEALTELAHALPAGLHITKVYDLAEFVRASIANVRDAILIGGVLAIVILLVFLRDWRLTFIAAMTLPLAVLITFLVMNLFGESINLMSMGGLAVAIGLVIDDAVVVVEGIHRRVQEGSATAIADAVHDLTGPVVSSTLTTVVVFAPLGLLSGVVGQFFRSLSLTLSAAVLASLVLALTLIPLLARWGIKRDTTDAHPGGRLIDGYAKTLRPMLARPLFALVLALALAAAGALLYLSVGSGFLPRADEGGFVVDYLTPPGTALEETDRVLKKIERVILDTPEVASVQRRTGSELGLFATPQNSGDVLVRLKPRDQRHRSSEEVISDLRDKLSEAAPGVEIEFVQLLQDALEVTRRVLALDRECDDNNAVALDLTNLGNILRAVGDLEGARARLEEALAMPGLWNDPKKLVYAQHNLAHVYRAMGNHDKALDCLMRNDEIARVHLLPIQRSFHLTSIAHIRLQLGQVDRALDTYRTAVDLSRRARHADGLVQSLRMLGNALLGLARYDEAMPCLDEAAQLFAQLEDRASEAEMRSAIARILERSSPETAADAWSALLTLHRRRGDVGGELDAREGLARSLRARGPDAAIPAFESALALAATLGERAREAAIENILGILEWDRGRYGDALRHYESVLALIRGHGVGSQEALILNSLGACLTKLHRPDEARTVLERSLMLSQELGERQLQAHALTALGHVALNGHDFKRAEGCFEESLIIRRTTGDRVGEGWMQLRLADLRTRTGDAAGARAASQAAAAVASETADQKLASACTEQGGGYRAAVKVV